MDNKVVPFPIKPKKINTIHPEAVEALDDLKEAFGNPDMSNAEVLKEAIRRSKLPR